jgi:hypothetical protein
MFRAANFLPVGNSIFGDDSGVGRRRSLQRAGSASVLIRWGVGLLPTAIQQPWLDRQFPGTRLFIPNPKKPQN